MAYRIKMGSVVVECDEAKEVEDLVGVARKDPPLPDEQAQCDLRHSRGPDKKPRRRPNDQSGTMSRKVALAAYSILTKLQNSPLIGVPASVIKSCVDGPVGPVAVRIRSLAHSEGINPDNVYVVEGDQSSGRVWKGGPRTRDVVEILREKIKA